MALLNRTSSGLIFQDTFSAAELNPVWQASPNNPARYSLVDKPGVLRMKHGDPDLFILMSSPRGIDYVMELDTDYDPIRASDQAGLVAFYDQSTQIELLEYYDSAQGISMKWGYLRMVRNGDLFSAYGSNDGKVWTLVGADYLAAAKIGMVLHGIQESQSDTMDAVEFRLYRDTNVQIGNLREGLTVRLKSETGTLIREARCGANADYVKIDVSDQRFPLKGKLELYDATNNKIAETELLTDLWGGDLFFYGIKLDMEIDGVAMREDRSYQLGNMSGGLIEKKVYVVNNSDIPIPKVGASIAAYSEYAGWQWVQVAPDIFNSPGTYRNVQALGTIPANGRVPLWIRIVRQPQQQVATLSDYKFRIVFEGG